MTIEEDSLSSVFTRFKLVCVGTGIGLFTQIRCTRFTWMVSSDSWRQMGACRNVWHHGFFIFLAISSLGIIYPKAEAKKLSLDCITDDHLGLSYRMYTDLRSRKKLRFGRLGCRQCGSGFDFTCYATALCVITVVL